MRSRAKLSQHKAFDAILVFAVCFVVYGNTLGHGYAYDDAVVTTENKFTSQGVRGIPDIFARNTFAGSYEDVPLLERYRPLSLASFAVERDLFGPRPQVGHFFNVLLFALATWLLLVLLRRLIAGHPEAESLRPLPLVAALLFAVHPVHTEIVANIKGRDEILVLAGALSAMIFVLKSLEGRRLGNLTLAFLAFTIALFSKENAITFLAVVPLSLFLFRKEKAKGHLISLLPLALASVVFLMVRALVLTGTAGSVSGDILTDPFALASRSQRFATVVFSLGAYLKLLLFPHPLTIDYQPFHIRLMDWGHPAVWLAVTAHVALAAIAVWGLRKRSVIAFGILFYLATLSLVSNLPFSTGTFMSERFMFVPSVGFVIVLARLFSHPRMHGVLPARYANVALAALLLVGAGKTISRNSVWKDDFTLLTTDARTSEGSVKANMAAAVAYLTEASRPERESLRQDFRARALEHAKKAVSAYEGNVEPARRQGSSYHNAVMLLGNTYSENGLLPEAVRSYRTLIGTSVHRGPLEEMIQTTINKSDDADFRLNSTLEFASVVPDSPVFNYHLGLFYGRDKHDLPLSIAYFKKAVDIAPENADALRGLGHAYTLSNDFEKAALCFEKLAERNPSDGSLLRTLFDLYRRAGNTAKQEEVVRRLQAN
jgi:tetratricopeptide (TPR) repeat protein